MVLGQALGAGKGARRAVEEAGKSTGKSTNSKSLPRQYRTTYTVTLEDEISLFDSWLIFTPSVRQVYYRNDFSGNDDFLSPPNGGKNVSEGLTSGKIGAKLNMTDYFLFKGNVGQYYRIPTFSELFGDRG